MINPIFWNIQFSRKLVLDRFIFFLFSFLIKKKERDWHFSSSYFTRCNIWFYLSLDRFVRPFCNVPPLRVTWLNDMAIELHLLSNFLSFTNFHPSPSFKRSNIINSGVRCATSQLETLWSKTASYYCSLGSLKPPSPPPSLIELRQVNQLAFITFQKRPCVPSFHIVDDNLIIVCFQIYKSKVWF